MRYYISIVVITIIDIIYITKIIKKETYSLKYD